MSAQTCSNEKCAKAGKLMCSKCEDARYCSAECQMQHWGQHKAQCKAVAAAKASAANALSALTSSAQQNTEDFQTSVDKAIRSKMVTDFASILQEQGGNGTKFAAAATAAVNGLINGTGSTAVAKTATKKASVAAGGSSSSAGSSSSSSAGSSSSSSSSSSSALARRVKPEKDKETPLPSTGSSVDVTWYKRPRNAGEDSKATARLRLAVSQSIAEKIERDSRCDCCAGYRDLDVGYMQHLWGECFNSAQKKEKKGRGMEALADYLKCIEVSYQIDQMIEEVEEGKREHSQRGKDIVRDFFAEMGDAHKPEAYLFRFFANVLLARVTVGLLPCAARLGLRLIAKEQLKYCRDSFLFDANECAVEGNLEPLEGSSIDATFGGPCGSSSSGGSGGGTTGGGTTTSSSSGGRHQSKQLTTTAGEESAGSSVAKADESKEERYKSKVDFLVPPTSENSRAAARRVRETRHERKLLGLFLEDLQRLETKFLCKKRDEAAADKAALTEAAADDNDDMMETED